jgi:rubrerythrin
MVIDFCIPLKGDRTMNIYTLLLSTVVSLFLCSTPALSAGRYSAARCPETVSVLQLLCADANKDARGYLTYANQAQQEGHEAIAQLFAALARSQESLAENSQLLLAAFDQEAGDSPAANAVLHGTKIDLDLMINVALAGVEKRYSLFLEMVRPEGNAEAIASVQQALKVKGDHLDWVKAARGSLGLLGSKLANQFWVCEGCGAIVSSMPRGACAICSGRPTDFAAVTGSWKVIWAAENNPQLSKTERAYVRRFCRALFARNPQDLPSSPAMGAFDSAAYQKWGLGPRRAFCTEEMMYVAAVEEMVAAWDRYRQINLDNLTEPEKQYLQKMHQAFGQGPINLSSKRGTGALSATLEKVLGEVEMLSGSKVLLDIDMIYIKRATAEQ